MKHICNFLIPVLLFAVGIGRAEFLYAEVLHVYTYSSFASEWGPGNKIKNAFEKKCECSLKFVVVDSSATLLSRIQLEGEHSSADVVLGLDANFITTAEKTGLIAKHGVAPKGLSIAWDSKTFLPFDYGYFAFIYDSKKIEKPPRSFAELLDSDLKIIIQDPRSSTPGLGLLLWVKSVFGDGAGDAWRKLKDKIVTVTPGWTAAYGLFLDGEADMVLSYSTSPAYHMINENENRYKAATFADGHGVQVEVAAVLKNSDAPRLARDFMKFILSDDFQGAIPTGNWMYPATRSITLPAAFDNLIKPNKELRIAAAEVEKNKDAWLGEFQKAFVD